MTGRAGATCRLARSARGTGWSRARSPTVVSSRWPQCTRVSSGSGRTRARQRREQLLVRAAGQVGAPDRAAEEQIAGEQPVLRTEGDRARACGPGCGRRRTPARPAPASRRRCSTRTSSGSPKLSRPKTGVPAGMPNADAGSAIMSRSSGWISAGTPCDPHTGTTAKTWSRWPWVSSTAVAFSPFSRRTASTASSTPTPGSMTMHSSPGAGATMKQFVSNARATIRRTSTSPRLPGHDLARSRRSGRTHLSVIPFPRAVPPNREQQLARARAVRRAQRQQERARRQTDDRRSDWSSSLSSPASGVGLGVALSGNSKKSSAAAKPTPTASAIRGCQPDRPPTPTTSCHHDDGLRRHEADAGPGDAHLQEPSRS